MAAGRQKHLERLALRNQGQPALPKQKITVKEARENAPRRKPYQGHYALRRIPLNGEKLAQVNCGSLSSLQVRCLQVLETLEHVA